MKHSIAVIVSIVVLSASTLAIGGDYPQWRGAARDGKSSDTGLLKQWPDGGPKLLWSAEGLGKGYATVAVANGLIYTTGLSGTDGVLTAHDLSGKLKWKKNYGPEWGKPGRWSFPGTRTTPTVNDGMVYVYSAMGMLVCFDAASGEQKWAVDTIKDFKGKNIKWGISESVLIDGDNVICQPGGKDAAVVAINKKTGKTVWTSKGLSDASAYCSPIAVKRGARRLIVTVTANAIVGLDAKTGSTLWRRPFRNKYAVHADTPIHHDGVIYVTAGYKLGGVALKLSDDGSKVTELWKDKKLAVQHGGAVLVDGYIYGANEKAWICLNFKSGKVAHEDKGVGKGSVTYADGMFYCYGENGALALVKADPKAYKTVSSFKIANDGGGKKHWAHPVVSGGRLYIRHGDILMAFDIKAK